ncbi:hypothetical protein LCGC14_2510880, partial [marine sediment metagenome]
LEVAWEGTPTLLDGVWTGRITISELATDVVLLAGDGNGHAVSSNAFDLITAVVGRHVFYNNSAWDADDPAANKADDDAIALDKQALRPGQTATFANYTSYARGLNGIMVDIAGLANSASLNARDDFKFALGNNQNLGTWAAAPDPSQVVVRRGAGEQGSDRVTILWEDNAIEKQWLQVTVLATENTGLAEPDVFYFGNTIGESGDQLVNAIVNATDEIGTRNFQHSPLNPAAIDDPYDFNRDQLVNGTDRILAQPNEPADVAEADHGARGGSPPEAERHVGVEEHLDRFGRSGLAA